MYNNGYMNYGYSPYNSANTYSYNNTPYYQPFAQQNQQQNQSQQTMQYQDVPYSEVRYGTLEEAKAYIVAPMKAVMFINQDLSEFYVKSADNMGKPSLEVFKYSKSDTNSTKPVSSQNKPNINDFGDDFDLFVRRDELNSYLTKENVRDFATKKDIKGLVDKIEVLQKQLNIADIINGEVGKSGK